MSACSRSTFHIPWKSHPKTKAASKAGWRRWTKVGRKSPAKRTRSSERADYPQPPQMSHTRMHAQERRETLGSGGQRDALTQQTGASRRSRGVGREGGKVVTFDPLSQREKTGKRTDQPSASEAAAVIWMRWLPPPSQHHSGHGDLQSSPPQTDGIKITRLAAQASSSSAVSTFGL